MTMQLRPGQRADIPACSRVMFEAFWDIAERHGFLPDFPNVESVAELLTEMMLGPGFNAFVAEDENGIIGSIFVSQRSSVSGISVITVDPKTQDRGVGRRLMQHGMDFLSRHGHTRQQLVQAGYHNRSLCLYSKLGFTATEMLSNMTGPPIKAEFPGLSVRRASEGDATFCDALCRHVFGFDRGQEVAHAILRSRAVVVERAGRITGYTTGVGFTGHGVGATNDDLKALITAAAEITGPGILIPTGNSELFRWCLTSGLRVVQQMILMDTQPSGPPHGVYWPAVLC